MLYFKQEEKDGINPYVFRNIFTTQEYSKIDSLLITLPYEKQTSIAVDGKPVERKDIRSSKVKWILASDDTWWLFEKLQEKIVIANNSQFKYDLYPSEVKIQYTEYYADDKGHYTWHMDHGVSFASHRKLSVSIPYNDSSEFEGGTLNFFNGGIEYHTEHLSKGDMCIFSSWMLHRVSAVTKGCRKSLVMWVGGSAFR